MTETPNDAATDVQQIIAELQRKLAERTAECDELLLQQAASAEILGVINSSHGDLAPVFDAMLEKAMRLCEAAFGSLYTFDGEHFQTAAQRGLPAAWADYRAKNQPSGRLEGPFIRLLETKRPVHIPDIKAEEVYRNGTAAAHALVDLGGGRSVLYVPLLKDHAVLGTIVTYRQEVRPFTDKQIALLENFAAQAVIAMENARLLGDLRQRTNDLQESLQQQTATADVLQVISNSVADTAPVFDKILEGCGRLFNGSDMIVFLVEDDEILKLGAIRGPDPDRTERIRSAFPVQLTGTATEQAIRERRLVTFGDVFNDPGVPEGLRRIAAQVGENHSVAIAPMLWEDRAIGAILVSRTKPMRAFDAAEQRLLQTFADQAVIAIQNAGLFHEAQARTRELSASLDELRAAQDRLVQTEKLASLGQLTAGIAHEIKNPLNFVNNFSALSAELVGEMKDALSDINLDKNKRE
jgi:two-component system NtrC family sensor kinase